MSVQVHDECWVSFKNHFAVVGDEVLPVKVWVDEDGDECGPDEAEVCLAGPMLNGTYVRITIWSRDEPVRH